MKMKPQGWVIIVFLIVTGFLIYTSPQWLGSLNKEINDNRKEKSDLELQEKVNELEQKIIDDSLIKIEERKNQVAIKKTQDSLRNNYYTYYNFLEKALEIDGNSETTNFLVLKRFDSRDSCNFYLIYKKESVGDYISRCSNTDYIELSNYNYYLDWFNVSKKVLPKDPFDFKLFKENKNTDIEKLTELMKEFKAEYLIEK
jgi:hypothetical protein